MGVYVFLSGIRFLFHRKKAPVFTSQNRDPGCSTGLSFDPAAKDDDFYQCERIVGKRLAKGVTQYCVKWAGYETKDNTWEPLENLAGCEAFIADFQQREQTRVAQAEAVAQQKHRDCPFS